MAEHTPFDRALLDTELRRDEGCEKFPYYDTTGHISVGVGRNLSDVGLSDAEIALLLANDVAAAETALDRHWPWWRELDGTRQRVMMNLVFNLGPTKLAGFVRFLAAVRGGSYAVAAHELASSLWHRQVGDRAVRLEGLMLRGDDTPPVA